MKKCEICLQLKDAGEVVQTPSGEFVLSVCRDCYTLIRGPFDQVK